MFCQSKCVPGASMAGKVRVDPEAIALEQARRDAEEAQHKEEQQRAEEEERKRLEEEEHQRLALAEEERRRQQEAEEARRKQEEEEAQRKQEADRRERERLEQELRLKRKAALDDFYQRHGFDGVNQPRKGACQVLKTNVTYPLHQAAELGNEQLVEYLLQEGAQVNQMNSSKLTAAQVAKKKDKGGSHVEVLRLLGQAAKAPSGGA